MTNPDSGAGPEDAGEKDEIFTMDFGFLPIPKRVQYDPAHPVHFGLVMNATFGFASTFVVANLYYCQPLLIQFSESFNVSYDRVSNIPTLIQAGYAVGLLFISPAGDLVRRRPLILLLTFICAALSIGLAITNNLAAFEALSFLVGVSSVVPQILMPLAADLAPPERRASALSIVLSGLLLGVLIARVLAGIVAQFVTWRVVYYLAIGLQAVVLALMYFILPDYPARNKGVTYWGILYSMGKFVFTEPMLVQAVLINIPSMACFTNYWVTLTFLLGGPPYHYSTLAIGLFGCIGIVGVCMAPLIGRLIDRLVPWSAIIMAASGLLVVQAIETGIAGVSIAGPVITAFGLDVLRQMQQVSITTAVFGLEPNARSRLNAVLILSLFIGQVMGTSVGSEVFNKFGWRPAAALSLAWTGFTIFIILARGPHVPRYTWFGYEGGIELRKSRLGERERKQQGDVEKAGTSEKSDAAAQEQVDRDVRDSADIKEKEERDGREDMRDEKRDMEQNGAGLEKDAVQETRRD
ncbi:hypothetical protein CERSUDRAFT_150654 [Gelatoporia subvermispora B]|uniref:Major facilitator superfamily (MFS) profile domain-containing protein n=1 Tax=Ceriporiopsis subvermispora (strain B) TaxID=914234 RepID=M2RM27_CERS8|nr:hypothetical protein CERSUDRAFT_150654 [Gelatoporia subvermispora B]